MEDRLRSMISEPRHDMANQTLTMIFALVGVVLSISSVARFR